MTERQHDCSLCGLEFGGHECHSSCPMSRGCKMVKCPRCGYEFVDESSIVNGFKKLASFFTRKVEPVGDNVVVHPHMALRLSEVATGTSCEITTIDSQDARRLTKLSSMGIVPGTRVTLIQRRPSVVISCGETTLALDDEVAREIFVHK